MKTITAAVVLLTAALPLCASSYYPSRPDDAKAVYLTRGQFSVRGDGDADDTNSIQQAINRVQETQGQGIVFVPSGRYRLTKTIYIWPGIRVIGYGSTRPAFVLGANTTGFQRGPAYMVFLPAVVLGTHASSPSARRPMTTVSQRMRARARSTRRSVTLILRFRTEIRAPLACAPTMPSIAFWRTLIFT